MKRFRSGLNVIVPVLNTLYQKELLLLILVLLASFILRCQVIHLPGPNPDELLYVFPADRLRMGDPLWCVIIKVGNISLPVGLDGYQGAFPIYVHWVISKLTNYTFRFRTINMLYALGVIILLYYFTKSYFNKRSAIINILFLSTMPSMVFFSRIGEMANFIRVILASALIYCFHNWWIKRNWNSYYAGCAVLGIGLSTRIEILWFVLAGFTYFLCLNRTLMGKIVSSLLFHKGKMLIGIMWLLVGGNFYILYNIVTKGGIIRQIAENLFFTYAGHSNLQIVHNLIERIKHLMILLEGGEIWGMSEVYRNALFSITFGIAFVAVFLIAVAKRFRGNPDHKSEFLIFMLMFLLFESTFSVSGINLAHLLIIIPIPLLIMVKFIDQIPYRYFSALIVVVLLVGNLWVDIKYYNSLLRNGGSGHYSPGVYGLVKELEQREISKIIACDWGLARFVYSLSNGNIKVEENFGYSQDVPPYFYDTLKTELEDQDNYYLFYALPHGAFKREEAFLMYLKEHGFQYHTESFYDEHGPLYHLIKAEQK